MAALNQATRPPTTTLVCQFHLYSHKMPSWLMHCANPTSSSSSFSSSDPNEPLTQSAQSKSCPMKSFKLNVAGFSSWIPFFYEMVAIYRAKIETHDLMRSSLYKLVLIGYEISCNELLLLWYHQMDIETKVKKREMKFRELDCALQ